MPWDVVGPPSRFIALARRARTVGRWTWWAVRLASTALVMARLAQAARRRPPVVVAPAGTPADIVTQLNRHIGQFLRNPDIQQRLMTLGLAISGTDTAETTAEFIRQQQASWRSLTQELDLRPE